VPGVRLLEGVGGVLVLESLLNEEDLSIGKAEMRSVHGSFSRRVFVSYIMDSEMIQKSTIITM
jgi:hypothetical protein